MARYALLLFLLFTSSVCGDVISYEGDVFPEDAGWERVGSFDADRWIEGGWFLQFVELGIWAPPPGGEFDGYQRLLTDFAGEPTFFIEWRMETGAPSSDMGGKPASLNASGTGAASYRFTITEDRVRVIRDNLLPIVYVDIEAGMSHTYRLDLYGDELYVWYIDGQLIDAGVPEAAYPTSDSNIIWAARFFEHEHTTRWDYIRYGTIPSDGSGDFDSDADRDLRDFYFFEECLRNGGSGTDAAPSCTWADMDADGDADLLDFAEFQVAFTPQ